MGMINLSQVKNGARLRHVDIKKINIQKFPITSDTSVTKFTITNKPEGAKYTYLYDTLSISVQIEINHNIYYENGLTPEYQTINNYPK